MIRKLFISACLVFISTFMFAQSPLGEGGKQFNFGLGLYDISVPVYLGVDFGVHPDITVGGQAVFDLGFDYLGLSARGDYHFNTLLEIPRDWDFYAGLNIGFAVAINDDFNDDLDLGLQVGGRYYWSDWGINLEIGGGNLASGGRIGLSKRF
jgi:hypothetical protein